MLIITWHTVQRGLRKDKQRQLDDMCDDLETVNHSGNSRKLFQKVRTITRKFQPRLQCIKSKTGTNLTEARQIAARWKEYCEDLSRASAAALSTVLRTTTLSYGNMRFSGIHPAETPEPIKMKFCKIDYVGELTRCAKNGCNRLAGGGPTDR